MIILKKYLEVLNNKVLAVALLVIFLGITIGFSQQSELPELIPYRKGNKWGFCDRNKKIVIPVRYDDVGFFSEGFAVVNIGGEIGSYDYMSSGKCGIINKKGETIIPIKYDKADLFFEGLAMVVLNGKYGFVDKIGKVVIPLKYTDARWGGFSGGLAVINLEAKPEKYGAVIGGKWGYIDKKGKIVIPIKYDGVSSFSNGLAQVWIKEKGAEIRYKYGYIDKKGTEYFEE